MGKKHAHGLGHYHSNDSFTVNRTTNDADLSGATYQVETNFFVKTMET
jgi:hypothetical protein